MTSLAPLVTIGVPTYGRPVMLESAVRSIMAQTYRNLRIIISDDASPDETPDVARRLAAEDARIEYIRQPTNLGVLANFEFVLEKATGTYFLWLSDDDRFEPTFIEKAVAVLEGHPDVALCFCDYYFINDRDEVTGTWDLPHLRLGADWKYAQLDFFRYPYIRSTVAVSGLYRLEALRRVGSLRNIRGTRVATGLEAPHLARTSIQGRIVALPERLFYYREHGPNQSAAHDVSNSLTPWQLVRTYLMIEAEVMGVALSANVGARQRLRFMKEVLMATVRKATQGRLRRNPRFHVAA